MLKYSVTQSGSGPIILLINVPILISNTAMSTSNHIVKSDPSEGSICIDAGVGGNQGYYPSIASSLLGQLSGVNCRTKP